MRWETRVHWLWGLIFPAFGYLLLFLLAGLALAFLGSFGYLVAFLLAAVGIVRISHTWAMWLSFSLGFLPNDNVLVERHGLVMVVEQHINTSLMGGVVFKQSPMGRLLDYGTLSVHAIGGPYEWENIGHFRTLRRIIETRGAWLP